jgi:hypothetical protein
MKKILITVCSLLFFTCIYAQEKDSIQEPEIYNLDEIVGKKAQPLAVRDNDDDDKVLVDPESGKASYLLYKVISHKNDTILIDTTLTLANHYKMNYLRKDLFGLHSFQNQGQVLTELTQNFNDVSIVPEMGQTAKHIAYNKVEDIKYYDVPTPTTEFLYRGGIEQGQILDSKIAINMNEQFNFSLGYTGLRSLGAYRNSLSSFKNFTGTVSYHSKNDRYRIRFHNTSQNIFHQENGGLTETAQGFFESNDPDFSDRGRLDINLEDANTSLIGKRYYIDHTYKLFSTKDSIPQKISDIKIGHIFKYETKRFYFRSPTSTTYFGDSFTGATDDKTSYKSVTNHAYLDFKSPYLLGKFRVLAGYHYYYQGYKKVVFETDGLVPNQIEGNAVSIGANWNATIKTIHLTANAATNIAGDLTGNNLFLEAAFKNNKKIEISTSLQLNSKAPNLNYTFFQSNFIEYNWSNDFKNIDTRNLNFNISTKWVNATATLSYIDNYLYFNNAEQATPTQHNEAINFLKIQAHNKLKFGYFALDTDFIYQSVTKGASVYKVPDLVVRSSFYFSKVFFKKKSLFLQTGATVNYFTAYNANNYNAVLGEFTLQTTDKIGGKPIVDLFINAQIRRTRVYFKFENMLSLTDNNYYYSTPNKPYKDFVIRFGFVWNFFK